MTLSTVIADTRKAVDTDPAVARALFSAEGTLTRAYSCDTPLWAVRGKEITTVEGLGRADRPHPVTRALLAEQAAQCGYCLSGIIVAAVALLGRAADPSEEQVRAALDGNLCRYGAHNRIVRAVLAAAAELRASTEGAAT